MKSRGIFPWLLAFCIVLLLVQSVRLLWTIATPIGPVGAWRPGSASVVPAAERAGLLSAFDPFFRADAPVEDAKVTAMNLTLFGTTVNQATGGGSAIIAGEDSVQTSYAVGDEIVAGVTLYAVATDHVVIQNGGSRERLYLDQSIPAEAVSADEAGTPAAAASPSVAGTTAPITAESVRQAISFQPRTEGKSVTGVVVNPAGDGAMFGTLGFQPGDIITSVNGRAIQTPADAAALNSQMRPGARLSLQVERGANTVPIAVILE